MKEHYIAGEIPGHQLTIFYLGPKFHGETFVAEFDAERLAAQERRVYDAMLTGNWLTLREISNLTGDPEASVSARIRGLRGYGLTVNRRRRGDPKKGLHEYQLAGAM